VCGIVGGIGYEVHGAIKNQFHLLDRRGPDHQQLIAFENGLILGATRLSLTDPLPRSNQPMENQLTNDVIVFNGQIFNFKKLRSKLNSDGLKLITESDTEVLLKSLTAYGTSCIPDLEGMFAFVFYDKAKNYLVLARDFMGKKPLYYHLSDGFFIFSSQLNLIKKCLGQVSIDDRSLINYLVTGYTTDPLTIYTEITSINPGEYIVYDINTNKIIHQESYFPNPLKAFPKSNLRRSITNSITSRVEGHSNFAISLSGGLDSSIIALTAAELDLNATAFSMRWPGSDKERYNFDFQKASNFAKKIGMNFDSVDMPSPNLIPDLLDEFTRAMEEPNANPTGLSMMVFYSQIAKNGNRIVLTGDGADEVFGGYERYLAVNRLRLIPQFQSNMFLKLKHNSDTLTKLIMTVFRGNSEEFWLNFQKIIDLEKLSTIFKHSHASLNLHLPNIAFDLVGQSKNRIANLLVRDLKTWLVMESNRKLDRVSMWNSIEARSPFLDENVIGQGFHEMNKHNFKKLNKSILIELYPELPQFDKNYRKQGFVSPLGFWLRNNPDLINDSIKYLNSNFDFDHNELKLLASSPFKGNFTDFRFLWSLIVLANWHSYHISD
jgi:asparagine synthase (glutamine-hydrolysing)